MLGTTVTCELLITNNVQDRKFRLYGYWDRREISRIFNDASNEYIASQIQLGDISTSGFVEILLVSGIPTKARLSFEKVSAQANRIALLEILCYLGDRFKVQFRNIPIRT